MSLNNSCELKHIVEKAVANYIEAEIKNPIYILLLEDLGLLLEA
jgi:hypothetical protein